jgi:hypothetical protein
MTDVSFCEDGVGVGKGNAFFFEKFYRGTHRAGLGGGYIPRRCTPTTPSAPGQTTQHRKQRRPRTDTHARTLDTPHRSALDTRQAAPGANMLHTQHFYVLVRLILNILLTCTFNHV